MAIWVIITTSLINIPVKGKDYETRRTEYIAGIKKIIDQFQGYNIVIVENNSLLSKMFHIGPHITFLNKFNVPVLYTRNNQFINKNYGINELLDIFDCIKKFNIQDDDFIVKVTGRYLLNNPSEFVNQVKKLSETNYDAIVRYGSYMHYPPPEKSQHCVTGLIGLRCKYVKQIQIPDENTFVEEKWGTVISTLDETKIKVLPILGIYIRPEIKTYYFLV